ncbi:MAG: hypothetical protein JNL81_05835 [Hyphomonadaceae bacterium]|nr:hypothetical protein [Hyphomonadaceae bacterium]
MTEENAAPISTRPRSRIIVTAAIYFLLVFVVGLVLGPVRVLWLEPVLGRTIAVLCETPFLIAAMVFAARWSPRWTKLSGGWLSYLAVGFIALALQQLADLAVGFGLRGMTLNDQLAFFATPPGYIYAANLIIFAVAPLLVRRRRVAEDQSAMPSQP